MAVSAWPVAFDNFIEDHSTAVLGRTRMQPELDRALSALNKLQADLGLRQVGETNTAIRSRIRTIESSSSTFAGLKTFSRGLRVVDQMFYDDFAGNGLMSGRKPTIGSNWATTGTGAATAHTADGEYRSEANVYSYQEFSETPQKVTGRFKIAAGDPDMPDNAGIVITMAARGGANLIDDMIHPRLSSSGIRCSLWTSAYTTPPAWAPATKYARDDVVLSGDNRYAAKKNLTSRAAFDATEQRDWILLGTNVVGDSPMASTEQTGAMFFDNQLEPGEYLFEVGVQGKQVHCEVREVLTDKVRGVLDCADPRVPAIIGPASFWQLQTQSPSTVRYVFSWLDAGAVRKRPTVIDEKLDAPSGINGPIGMEYRSQGNFSRVGIGRSDASIPLDVVWHSTNPGTIARFVHHYSEAKIEVRAEASGAAARIELIPFQNLLGGGLDLISGGDGIVYIKNRLTTRIRLPYSATGGVDILSGPLTVSEGSAVVRRADAAPVLLLEALTSGYSAELQFKQSYGSSLPAAVIRSLGNAADLRLRTNDTDRIIIAYNGNIGFFGSAGSAKPAVAGSRGGNAALASLLTGLAGLGLLTDNTTA